MDAIKVLIVDDSMFFREVLARGLKNRLPSGSDIEKAGEPFAARDKILSFDPDVMILDVEMPNMNGIEFLRLLNCYPLENHFLNLVFRLAFSWLQDASCTKMLFHLEGLLNAVS